VIEEGSLMPDHVHMLISSPPQHKVIRAYIESQEKEDQRLDDLLNRS
jgi:REP element-mobilizing transposase RayT